MIWKNKHKQDHTKTVILPAVILSHPPPPFQQSLRPGRAVGRDGQAAGDRECRRRSVGRPAIAPFFSALASKTWLQLGVWALISDQPTGFPC